MQPTPDLPLLKRFLGHTMQPLQEEMTFRTFLLNYDD